MSRFLWLSLIFCVSVSLLWWPSAKNHSSIFELIERERTWQSEYLGFDLVDKIDYQLQNIQSFIFQSPIPTGSKSTLRHSEGLTDHEIQGAVLRISQEPYFQAMFALIVLAIGRLLVTLLLGLLLCPLFLAVGIDALCARKVRQAKFQPSSSFQFRIAFASFFILIEAICVTSLVPIWIDPFLILISFLIISTAIHQLISHYYD